LFARRATPRGVVARGGRVRRAQIVANGADRARFLMTGAAAIASRNIEEP
jgi:hypothetical protein